MRLAVTLLLSGLLLTGCVPASQDRLSEQIAEDAGLRAIQDRGVLRVGLPEGPAGLGGSGGGLAAEVASWVAEALEVEAEFTHDDTDAILNGVHEGDLDLAFPVMPITEGAARSKKRSYTAPYFVAHQRMLLAPGIDDQDSVAKVCMFGDARTQIPPENVRADLQGVRSNDADGCGRMLASGVVDAVFAPDLLLFELEAALEGTTLQPEGYNTEGYSAVVQHNEIGVANFFDAVLARSIDDGRWSQAYEEHLAPLTSLDPAAPDLTAEEAAALFPRGLPLS